MWGRQRKRDANFCADCGQPVTAEDTWLTGQGESLKVQEMETRHLANCVAYFLRDSDKLSEGRTRMLVGVTMELTRRLASGAEAP